MVFLLYQLKKVLGLKRPLLLKFYYVINAQPAISTHGIMYIDMQAKEESKFKKFTTWCSISGVIHLSGSSNKFIGQQRDTYQTTVV